MGIFSTRIKDSDLVNVLILIRETQRLRNDIEKDPVVLAEGYTTGGKRRDTYSEVVSNRKKWINEGLAEKLQAVVKKLKK